MTAEERITEWKYRYAEWLATSEVYGEPTKEQDAQAAKYADEAMERLKD